MARGIGGLSLSRNLVLWGRASSANVQKTLWALEERGLPYEHHLVGGAYAGWMIRNIGS